VTEALRGRLATRAGLAGDTATHDRLLASMTDPKQFARKKIDLGWRAQDVQMSIRCEAGRQHTAPTRGCVDARSVDTPEVGAFAGAPCQRRAKTDQLSARES
jgi:hypothetical protein